MDNWRPKIDEKVFAEYIIRPGEFYKAKIIDIPIDNNETLFRVMALSTDNRFVREVCYLRPYTIWNRIKFLFGCLK